MKYQFVVALVFCLLAGTAVKADDITDLEFTGYAIGGLYYGTIQANYDATGNNHDTNFNPILFSPYTTGVPYSSEYQFSLSEEKKLYADSGTVELGGVKADFEGGTQAATPLGNVGGATLGMRFGGQLSPVATDGELKNNEVQVIWSTQFTNPTASDVNTTGIFELTIPSSTDSVHPSSVYTASDGTTTSHFGDVYGFQVEWFDVNNPSNNVIHTVAVPYSADEQVIQIVDPDIVFEAGVDYQMDIIWTFQTPDFRIDQSGPTGVGWAPTVSFSMPIPEPGTLALLGFAGLALLRRGHRS